MKTILAKVLQVLQVQTIRQGISSVSIAQRFYLAAFVVGVLLPPSVLIYAAWTGKLPDILAWFTIILPSGVGTIGVLWEVTPKIRRLWKYPLRAVIVGIFIYLIAQFSSILAKQSLNLAIPINPSHFPDATKILTIPISIFIWWYIIVIVLLLTHVSMLVIRILTSIPTFVGLIYKILMHRQIPINLIESPLFENSFVYSVIYTMKIFANLGYIYTLFFLLLLPIIYIELSDYFKFVRTVAAFSDYYTFSECKNQSLALGERVMFINDTTISIAKPHPTYGYTFETRACIK